VAHALSRLAIGVGAAVVTNTVEVEVAHPAWQVSHGPSIVFVGVLRQHGSAGGTNAVVVSKARHSICGGHAARSGHSTLSQHWNIWLWRKRVIPPPLLGVATVLV
jgi:hypothetical protein